MTITDYALDIGLIALVLVQIRDRRLTARSLLLPLVVVAWAAAKYLHGIPTAGNDLVLVVGAAAIGATLGALSGALTSVRMRTDGALVARAGAAAAILWVLGVGSRFAFQLYAAHGGGAALERFSVAHHITSNQAWVAALLLMALGEVAFRTAVLAWRGCAVRAEAARVAPPPASRASIMVGGEQPL
jgi:hypothetical protein